MKAAVVGTSPFFMEPTLKEPTLCRKVESYVPAWFVCMKSLTGRLIRVVTANNVQVGK